MATTFCELFQQSGAVPERGKFLSRLFGIFSEQIVREWAADPRAPYENLGRPTLACGRPAPTLDFLFKSRTTGQIFVVEQKCEIEYQNYRYLTLTHPHQLTHHSKNAFQAFLAAAAGKGPDARQWKVDGKPIAVDGSIVVWGCVSDEGRRAVIRETGLHDVLGLDDIIRDCAAWQTEGYRRLINERHQWSADLFGFLCGDHHDSIPPSTRAG